MRRPPFKLVAGLLIAAIIGLAVVAASLALAIFEEETSLRATEVTWPTPTRGQQAIATFWLSESPTASASGEINIMPSPVPPAVPSIAPDQQGLPFDHPAVAPNSPCADCHQAIHEGGE
ncbi:MAG: hypothetical protein HZB19_06725 [Chloroflexi bacterium]|nr:hypothetical protein [Chloroflexota bacterium]